MRICFHEETRKKVKNNMTNDDQNHSISKIMDGIIEEVDKTRRVFTILIVLIILPLAMITLMILVAFLITNNESVVAMIEKEIMEENMIDEMMTDEMIMHEEMMHMDMISDIEGVKSFFGIIMTVAIGFVTIMVIVISFGIKQLISLKQWTRKYKKFKDRLAEIDKKLDEEFKKD